MVEYIYVLYGARSTDARPVAFASSEAEARGIRDAGGAPGRRMRRRERRR